MEATVCDLLCSYVGIDVFVKLVQEYVTLPLLPAYSLPVLTLILFGSAKKLVFVPSMMTGLETLPPSLSLLTLVSHSLTPHTR